MNQNPSSFRMIIQANDKGLLFCNYSVPVLKKWKEKHPQTNTETLQNNSKWSILYYVVYLYWDKKLSLLHVSVDYLFILS